MNDLARMCDSHSREIPRSARDDRVPYMSKLHQFIIALALVAFVIVMRLVPHPANVAPVAAAALFARAYLSKRWAFTVPVIAMRVSDMVIGFYEPAVMLSVYACLVFSSVLGSYTLSLRGARRATRQSRSLAVIVLATLTGSITFFIVTNFAVL